MAPILILALPLLSKVPDNGVSVKKVSTVALFAPEVTTIEAGKGSHE